jgi:hypothetical protein
MSAFLDSRLKYKESDIFIVFYSGIEGNGE